MGTSKTKPSFRTIYLATRIFIGGTVHGKLAVTPQTVILTQNVITLGIKDQRSKIRNKKLGSKIGNFRLTRNTIFTALAKPEQETF